MVGVAVASGATGAIRPQTVIFLPVVLLAWTVLDASIRQRARAQPHDLLLGAIATPLAFGALWPMFWTSPIESFARIARFFLHPPPMQGRVPVFYLGHRYGIAGAPWHYPLIMTVVTTPLPVLALAMGAVGRALAARDPTMRRSIVLPLVWLTIGAGKHSVVTGNYDGVRHLLEAFPALAWLAGLGLVWLLDALRHRLPGASYRAATTFVVLALVIGLPARALWQLHPYAQLYYNALAGGLAGADRRFDTEYWGFTVKEGMQWVNRHLPPEAVVAVPWGAHLVRYYQRPDLQIIRTASPRAVEELRARAARHRGGVYYLYHVRRGFISPTGGVAYVTRRFPKRFEIRRDGVVLLEVYELIAGA
jgi:hypothetical protein